MTEGSNSLLTAEAASSRPSSSASSSSRSVLVEGSSKGLGMRRPHLRPACLMGRTGVKASLEEMCLVADISSSSSSETCGSTAGCLAKAVATSEKHVPLPGGSHGSSGQQGAGRKKKTMSDCHHATSFGSPCMLLMLCFGSANDFILVHYACCAHDCILP